MDNVLVSFIVPVYNVRPYLGACLESILAQGNGIECICVDDGSTDGSGELLDELSAKDSRVVVLHQENAGVGAARNAGIERANGRYLSFVDSDDVLESSFTVRALAAFDQYSDLDIWMGQLLWVTPDNEVMEGQGVKTSLLNSTNPLDDFLWTKGRVYYYTVYPKLIRAELVKQPIYRFPVNARAGEDAAFMGKVYSGARRVISQDCFVYRYRVLQTGLLHSNRIQLVPDFIASHKDLQAFARATGRLPKLRKQMAFGALGTIRGALRAESREMGREYLHVLCSHPDFHKVILGTISRHAPFPFQIAGVLMLALPRNMIELLLLGLWRILHLRGKHA